MGGILAELGFPDRRQFSDRRNNFLVRRADDIVVAHHRGPVLSDLVLYLVRNCRRAGFGLTRSQTITHEEMKQGIANLIDDMADETGTRLPESERELLAEQIPLHTYHVDVIHPHESLSGAYWTATRKLQDILLTFKEEGNIAVLVKGEGILDFLAGLKLDSYLAAEVERFRRQFEQARAQFQAKKGMLDRLLDKVVAWRQRNLGTRSKSVPQN